VNPHTGQPLPAEAPAARGAGELAATPAATPAAPGGAAAGAPTAGAEASPAPGSAAPSQQELAVRSALETVMDPEIGLSVIDLGLIREVLIQPGRTQVRMLLTTPFCPYAPQLVEDIKLAAKSVVDQDCDVEIMPDPWSPEMMPDPGLLGFSY
jgi:metal-sulfur cluster biosynthetic enzyme